MAQTSVEPDMYLDEIETWESFIETKKKESNECGERVGLYRITSGTKEAARRFAGGSVAVNRAEPIRAETEHELAR